MPGLRWVYGRRTVQEVIESDQTIYKLYLSENIDKSSVSHIIKGARKRCLPLEWIPRKKLDQISRGNHQGVAVQIEELPMYDLQSFLESLNLQKKPIVCLLDEVQDPQNLGAIMRSAVCFGVSGIIVPKWRSAGITEAVMKSSSGAASYLPVVQIANLGVAIDRLKENGFLFMGPMLVQNNRLQKQILLFLWLLF